MRIETEGDDCVVIARRTVEVPRGGRLDLDVEDAEGAAKLSFAYGPTGWTVTVAPLDRERDVCDVTVTQGGGSPYGLAVEVHPDAARFQIFERGAPYSDVEEVAP